MPETISLREFAHRTGRSYHGCWQLLADGRLKALRDEGNRWRIPVGEVDRFVKRPGAAFTTAVPA